MKIYRSRYGWSTTAHSKNKDGSQVQCYIEVGFRKDAEPHEDLEGEMIFRTKDGEERPCFLSSYKKGDGSVVPKLVVLEPKGPKKFEQTSLAGDVDVTGHTLHDNQWEIKPDELPFY